MGPAVYRDKLIHLFFSSDEGEDRVTRALLKSWGSSLKSLRWHEVLNFVVELKRVQPGLQQRWNLERFVNSMPRDRQAEPQLAEGRGPEGANHYRTADSAIRSDFFWCFCDMMLAISAPADVLSRWGESCWYHGRKCSERSCPHKGAKGPELAAGIHRYLLKLSSHHAQIRLCEVLPKLGAEEAELLITDWHAAHSRLNLEFQFKFHFWNLLPWKLCGVSCTSLQIAQCIAQECISMWAGMSAEQRAHSHPMTRRFLDRTWEGTFVLEVCSFMV